MLVDFVIVAALKDEGTALTRLLENIAVHDTFVTGRVTRWKGKGYYNVALVNLFDGMGTNNAQSVTQQAISQLHPKGVLMTGIAAGFEDSKARVALGDLMVPYGIVPYEQARITGVPKSQPKLGMVRWAVSAIATLALRWAGNDIPSQGGNVEHRGIAWAVAETLWAVAAQTANDPEQPWMKLVAVSRPDGAGIAPRIHVASSSVMGCGEKVVADEEAEVRRWLLAAYPRQILGLEMESYGALRACRTHNTPFLLAKASVDKATSEKDDGWRNYACQLSAAFLVTVLQRCEFPTAELLLRHRDECERLMSTLEQRTPKVNFQCKIRTAQSFQQVRQGLYDGEARDIEELIPTDIHPNVVLYGGGGTGKTTIIRRLFPMLIKADLCPVLIDLKKYSREYADIELEGSSPETIESIVQVASSPRRTASDIEQLAAQSKLVLLIDAVNEISKPVLESLLAFCQELRRGAGCLCLWTNRMAPVEDIRVSALHAVLEKVAEDVAEHCFDDKLGVGRYKALSARLQAIYRRPFFLDLAIRSRREFVEKRLWSGIFREFFVVQLSVGDLELDTLAKATLGAIAADGKFRVEMFRKAIGIDLWHRLDAAQVRVLDDDVGFEHHLWRDYLVALALSLDPSCWTEETFDAATTFGTSLECLLMAVEQIVPVERKVDFVKRIYDWSYVGAIECIAKSGKDEEAERKVPESLREAIAAVVAEKRFDMVPRTSARTQRLLDQYPFAVHYSRSPSRDAIVEHVRQLQHDDKWFRVWQRLYCNGSAYQVPVAEVELIGSEDSVIGWTATNLARRGQLSLQGQEIVRTLFQEHLGTAERRSVRWRAVHVLGKYPTKENVDLLVSALKEDDYRWVTYGAARSLVEVASHTGGDLRKLAVSALLDFISGEWAGSARNVILEEIVETCFITDSTTEWRNAARPLLEKILERIGSVRRGEFTDRISKFANGR
jgi:nucleoside phosphorylase